MARMSTSPLIHVVFLSGAIAIGYPSAMLLHELGHVLAAWLVGGSVRGITVHPFSWSYAFVDVAPEHDAFTTWAGALFSSVAGLLLFGIGWFVRSTWFAPLLITALCAFIINGLYLGIDALLEGGGDGMELLQLGIPMWVLLSTGATLMTIGAVAWCAMVPRFGVAPDASACARLGLVLGGAAPYLLALLVYHWTFNRDEARLWSTYVVGASVILAAMAIASLLWSRRWPHGTMPSGTAVAWPQALTALVIGVGLVTLLLVYGHLV